MAVAIRIEGLGKCYRVARGQSRSGYRTLRESLADAARGFFRRRAGTVGGGRDEFWALKDVSFDVRPGEVVGVIGRNGAGKSTLLKILSRITKPTEGRVEIHGRVGSLLEVGTGFHPELTGRENVYLNGSILGMSRKEIDQRFDEIVAFAEVERFLDTPVKRYSSGMYVRLAFAVAAHLEPEILIVDEVLAVGDAGFQKKCLTKIQQVGSSGATVLLVSHQMPSIQYLCPRCVLLDGGTVCQEGRPEAVIAAYNRLCQKKGPVDRSLVDHPGRDPGSIPTMVRVGLRSDSDPNGQQVLMNEDLEVTTEFHSSRRLSDITFGLVIKNEMQSPVFGFNTLFLPAQQPEKPVRKGSVSCLIERLPLVPGRYFVDLYFGTHGRNFDIVHSAAEFEVLPVDVFGTGKLPPPSAGNIFWPATWRISCED